MKQEKNFSELLSALENVVVRLEKDDIPLEDSFELYKKGLTLAQSCYEKLKSIETKILLVTENKGEFEEEEFGQNAETSAADKQEKEAVKKKPKGSKEKEVHDEAAHDGIILPGLFENH